MQKQYPIEIVDNFELKTFFFDEALSFHEENLERPGQNNFPPLLNLAEFIRRANMLKSIYFKYATQQILFRPL